MNPLFERKLFLIRYVVFYVLFGVVYALVFGWVAGLTAEGMAADGAVFTAVSGFGGLALWSILKYGADSSGRNPVTMAYYIMAGILFSGVTVGAECLVISQAVPGEFPGFVQTLPARSLVLALVYALFALYYAYAGRSCEDSLIPEPQASAAERPEALERITIRGGQKIKVIAVDEIIYLQAEGDYVAIVTAEGRFLKEQTMKYFDENLPAGSFVRVHRSYIVSVTHISRIEQSGREHSVVLRDGSRIRISDTGYKLLRSVLGL